MGSRRLSRVTSLQILYLVDLCKISQDEAIEIVCKTALSDAKAQEFCLILTKGVISNMKAIDEFIKEERTAGNLNRDDELKLNREMRNLTAAKKAGALSMIGLSYYKANKIIVENTPSELRNVVRARVFDIVQAEMLSAEEAGKPLDKGDQRNLWSKYALSTSTEVIDEERQRSQDSIRDVLSRTQVAPPTGAVIIKFDAQGNRI